MIIAVATEEQNVAAHFGRCSAYTLVKFEDGKMSRKKVIPNPGHEPGYLPGYLAGLGVRCIVAGGMGPRAQQLFAAENIDTYLGITGQVSDVIDAYLAGELETKESICDHHRDGHACGS